MEILHTTPKLSERRKRMTLSEKATLRSSWTIAEAFQNTGKIIQLNKQKVSQLGNAQKQTQQANLNMWPRQVETGTLRSAVP